MPRRETFKLFSVISIPVLAIGGVLIWMGLEQGWWRLNHPDLDRYPVWGVDVSHHQGAIDWTAAAREPHLKFAFIKATEGVDWTDPSFARNWRGARQAGFKVGAYHFFNFCRMGRAQAQNFLTVLPKTADRLPPVLDLEFSGNCVSMSSHLDVRREVEGWVKAVQSSSCQLPIVYTTREAYHAFLEKGDLKYPIWIRDVWKEPALPTPSQWSFWQFADRGHVHGISGFVDLNVFNGTERCFELSTSVILKCQ